MLSTPQNSPPEGDLAARHAGVQQRISAAATAAGRDVHSITLLAVTKGHDAACIRDALALGMTDFGENYVDEALPKIQSLADTAARWHFIGRLQANKTRHVANHFAWVHSIDRLRIAERLSAQRSAHDPAKGGIDPGEALALARTIQVLPRLKLRGLMCMLPYDTPVAGQHQAFAALRLLLHAGQQAGLALDTLSMGMSDDLEAAIAEGATIVRVGTALFGSRAT
jgi:PLP dependent protein